MATTVFQITPYSSYSLMRDGFTIDDRYHTVPFDDRPDPTQYFQKIQTGDNNLRVQLLSDFTPTLRLYDCNDVFIKNIAFTSRTIVGASFLVYDAVPDYSDVPEGAYYLKLTYTDETDTLQTLRTFMLDMADDWPDTMLLEYTNTFNDKGVIFVNDDNTLMVFGFRMELSFDEYQPLSLDIDYIDQNYDNEVLNNTPYDNEKLYTQVAPDWAIKKMNLVFTLNKVAIDNQYYNRVDGSKFTPVRPDHGVMIDGLNFRPTCWSIDIIPNQNFNLQQYQTGVVPTGDLIVIKKAKIYDSVAADFTATGLFTINSNLIRLAITNKNFDVFTLKLGTSTGDDDIATIEVVNNPDTGTPDLTSSYDIGHLFNTPTDVFVSGIDGTNLKVAFDWNQYDAPTLNPVTPGTAAPKGTVTIYEEITLGDFVLDWDIGTGLGLRNWVGWCLSGTNGTKNRAGKYSQGWNKAEVGPSTRGTEVGNSNNEVEITRDFLPAEGIALFDANVNNTRGDIITTGSNVARSGNPPSSTYLNYELLKGVTGEEPSLGISQKLGSGNPLSIEPDSWIDVWVVKITD